MVCIPTLCCTACGVACACHAHLTEQAGMYLHPGAFLLAGQHPKKRMHSNLCVSFETMRLVVSDTVVAELAL